MKNENSILNGNLLLDEEKEFVKKNMNAFIIGLIADQSVKVEIAWSLPYKLYKRLNTFDFKEILQKYTIEEIEEIINDMNPDGLEANYLYADRNDKKFDETEKWNEFAKEHNLFVTAGSDFHNKDGIRPEIGFVNTEFTLSEEEINEILRNLEK